MQAYSLDLRQRIAQACAAPGARQVEVAVRFSVSVAFVGKLLRRQRQTGQLAALPGRGGPPRCLDAAAQAWLVAQVGRQPDATLAELRDALQAETGRRVSVGAVWRVLDEQGLRRKKKAYTPRNATRSGYGPCAVNTWKPWPHGATCTGSIFWTRRACAWIIRGATDGHRAVSAGPGPLRRGKSLTLIGALGVRGLKAVQVLDGPLNQRSFALYVARVLGPQLRRGDVLVLDNLPVHKLGGVREVLARRGVELLFLPPYSPDFTPVEQAWSKLKTYLRHVQARTREALQAVIQTAVDWITSHDANAWFNHCGYHVHRS